MLEDVLLLLKPSSNISSPLLLSSPLLQLLSRRNALHERAQTRRAALEDSFHLQQFFRDSDELKSWINEKMKTATDEAYKVVHWTCCCALDPLSGSDPSPVLPTQDPSNLQGKVQKHQAFEAELSANQSRIDALQKSGQELLDGKHYASSEVAERMEEVGSQWKKLLEATELKGTTSPLGGALRCSVETKPTNERPLRSTGGAGATVHPVELC